MNMSANYQVSIIRKAKIIVFITLLFLGFSCNKKKSDEDANANQNTKQVTAKDILGNPDYLAISYGGYRTNTREKQPTIAQLKEDLRILFALDIKIIRTYNVHLKHASNVLEAIKQLKTEDANFEMYVMLGAWIDCKNAWTDLAPNHELESDRNALEIEIAVKLANQYPDIVKVIAVGNEAMVRWATSYYVQPNVILKWVNHLQTLKKQDKLPKALWITSSDDFASWGGGDKSYHTKDLAALVNAVDYVSMHTYPFHNSHYNPEFWLAKKEEDTLSELRKVDLAMQRAQKFAEMQYNNVKNYVKSINPNKPIHIGETGWASSSDGFYGPEGSKAADEYKQARFYESMRTWTAKEGISCFFFEAFNEPWKDSGNESGSENHFGLFTVDGKAKFALWNKVENQLSNIKRDGNLIQKSFSGKNDSLMKSVLTPPKKH
jgi:exo-beta-1,3-glucanase (GH17 family)